MTKKRIPKEPKGLTKAQLTHIINTRNVRTELAEGEFMWFFYLYFSPYITAEIAPFHKEMFAALSDNSIEHLVVVAFRGCGKSTIVTTAYPLWAVIGPMQRKCVLLVSQTQLQSQQHLRNLRMELESNDLFRNDFGPLEEESNEWGITSLYLPKYGARIVAVSKDQSIRGFRNGPHRPDLVISDDVEDMSSVKTREGRDKTYRWFTSEIIPLGTPHTRYVTVGNLLHEDSLLMRIRDSFDEANPAQCFLSYPIAEDGVPLWPGMYKDKAAIERMEKRVGNRVSWQREYMLNIVPDEDQVVRPDMIHYYDEMPELPHRYHVGVDLAISQKDSADCTAIITFRVVKYEGKSYLYVLPNPINRRMDFPTTISTLLAEASRSKYMTFYIEKVGYQSAVSQVLNQHQITAEGVAPQGDKRMRLNLAAQYMEHGRILFPRSGCEELIAQLTGFGIEKHDDLVDALTLTVQQIAEEDAKPDWFFRVGRTNFWDRQPGEELYFRYD